jgi:hypothetical protein
MDWAHEVNQRVFGSTAGVQSVWLLCDLHQLVPKICPRWSLDSRRQVAAGSESRWSPHRRLTKKDSENICSLMRKKYLNFQILTSRFPRFIYTHPDLSNVQARMQLWCTYLPISTKLTKVIYFNFLYIQSVYVGIILQPLDH